VTPAVNAFHTKDVWMHVASNAEPGIIEGAPLVSVDSGEVALDGLRVDDVRAVEQTKRPARLWGLALALRAREQSWRTVHVKEAWPGVVAYRFGADVPAAVVKSVIMTAGHAGARRGSVLVAIARERDARSAMARLAVDPLMIAEPHANLLYVHVAHNLVEYAWNWSGANALSRVALDEPDASRAFGASVARLWQSEGLHRDPHDGRFDQAIVHVDNDVRFATLVAQLDALCAARRIVHETGRDRNVCALTLNVAED